MREEERAMPWARLDDKFHDHPKLLEVSLAATGLYAIGLSYCSDHLTDGAIPRDAVQSRRGWKAAAEELVEHRLWEATDSGWRVHDFLDWNDSRAAVLARRVAAADRQRKARSNGVSHA